MEKEKILGTKPEELADDVCDIFNSDPEFKKQYEQKWDTEIECADRPEIQEI